ncbi:SCO family protein [Manganibacter manganicus]|uniref:Copper-binding protein n=1 Tax=Manganibacter manganicus TaxID=1873176 RepID=A0A1V8RR42_9HYPH|nr:SCO family protein [Pseudaminobacter manganicus]OQM75682.1 copper-binding protein [Pseudaminobacter manganicus]
MMTTRTSILLALLIASLAFAGFAYVVGVLPVAKESIHTGGSSSRTSRAFQLISHPGQIVSNETLRGKPYLAFFGFTNCPDICPTTLFELTELMVELGPVADAFNILLISVDPDRDTQEMLSTYMTAFDSRILALRGTREQTEAVLQAFGARAQKVPTGGDNYTMEHTAGVFLVDAEGGRAGVLDMHELRDTRLQKIRNLVLKSGK